MRSIADEIVKTIKYAVERQKINCDRTYKSVIKRIDKSGYVILDRTGSERTVKCCIPGADLKAGQMVWVKEPMSDLRNLHIAGVVEK